MNNYCPRVKQVAYDGGLAQQASRIEEKSPLQPDIENLKDVMRTYERILVISGAGISTNSGIGDYRDQNGDWKRVQPVKHQAFMASHEWRQRYWARSQLGYPSFLQAQPNDCLLYTSPSPRD